MFVVLVSLRKNNDLLISLNCTREREKGEEEEKKILEDFLFFLSYLFIY
jgi:hypothetical protein